jgi:aminoglycoside phosphotransferase (APT) family kinase protein
MQLPVLPTHSPSDALKIDIPLVTHLIASQFPQWAHLPVSPVALSGWDNRSFHLGTDMTVRLPGAEPYARAVNKEQTWLPRLAAHLPLPIPQPVALGEPDQHSPWRWSVYRWLNGEIATSERISDLDRFAIDLAGFLRAPQKIATAGGPARKLRGGSLDLWNDQAEAVIDALASTVDAAAVTSIWQSALAAPFTNQPVWYHGDIAAGNLLVQEGKLCAVIDFGGVGVGDPGCDMTIAWTLLGPSSRQLFRETLGVEDAVWNRGRGWALWKAMIILAGIIETNAVEMASAEYAVDQLLADYRHRADVDA